LRIRRELCNCAGRTPDSDGSIATLPEAFEFGRKHLKPGRKHIGSGRKHLEPGREDFGFGREDIELGRKDFAAADCRY
jgi:hypothetical protein